MSLNVRSLACITKDVISRLFAEGDHIKITASRYPFPTVCAQSQSVDWFHSISRTLKWNERERQKSFVVVEEAPVKRRRRRSSSASTASANDNVSERGNVSDEEDDGSTDGEEEEEKFDIDDLSSSESPKSSTSKSSSDYVHEPGVLDAHISREKAMEVVSGTQINQLQAEAAARALAAGNPHIAHYGPKSGVRSGVETPDRFAGPHPHPPKLSPRHVQFISPDVSSESSSTSLASLPTERDANARGERGTRDDIHSPKAHSSGRSRIPQDRDIEREAALRTPTLAEDARRRRSRDRASHMTFDGDSHPRRAFACWGQDESDSATSDSDV